MEILITKTLNLNRKLDIQVVSEPQNIICVASHERSGTHFLINSITLNTNYSPKHLDFDNYSLGHFVDFYSKDSVKNFFGFLKNIKHTEEHVFINNIIKTHHSADFFEPIFKDKKILFFYIYRHPLDLFVSYWKFLHTWNTFEGPLLETPLELIRATPVGKCLRYQWNHADTFLERWANNLKSWLAASKESENVNLIAYEDLRDNYDDELASLFSKTSLPTPKKFQKPNREHYIKSRDLSPNDSDIEKMSLHIENFFLDEPLIKPLFKF